MAPILISQCYNALLIALQILTVVAPILISQCYNQGTYT